MKRAIILSAAIILIVLIGLVTFMNYTSLNENRGSKPFYVGVTFGGNNTQDAKLLITKVKNYTNLFVLQSGPWNTNSTSEQIWTQLQSKLAQYGSRLDIVYDDSNYPLAGRYLQIYYWNQTT